MENINTKIGLVGLGIIGSSIFKNIHSAGQKSSGFDIDENDQLCEKNIAAQHSVPRVYQTR